MRQKPGNWLGMKGEGSISGFVRGFRQKGKSLCLALSQVNTGVILSLMPVMTKSRQQVLSESYGQGWFFVVSRSLEYKMLGGFLNLSYLMGAQGSAKVQHHHWRDRCLTVCSCLPGADYQTPRKSTGDSDSSFQGIPKGCVGAMWRTWIPDTEEFCKLLQVCFSQEPHQVLSWGLAGGGEWQPLLKLHQDLSPLRSKSLNLQEEEQHKLYWRGLKQSAEKKKGSTPGRRAGLEQSPALGLEEGQDHLWGHAPSARCTGIGQDWGPVLGSENIFVPASLTTTLTSVKKK